jgi:hypothetical protein
MQEFQLPREYDSGERFDPANGLQSWVQGRGAVVWAVICLT